MAKRKVNQNNGGNHFNPFHFLTLDNFSEQQKFAHEVYKQSVVMFLVGPAGTGKSHLAMAFAIKEILDKSKSKIILSRPVIEAGESLGYLPGNVDEKVYPYMIPLFDCLDRILGHNQEAREYVEKRFEVSPLAYLRGRSNLNSELLITPTGLKPMGEIKVGDYVVGRNGKPTKVLRVYPQGKIPIYEVAFSDRTKSICSAEHLWSTKTSDENRYTVKSTTQIMKDVDSKHQIPNLTAPVQFEEKEIEKDPYLIATSFLNRIPDNYKFNSVECRLAVLQGLCDSSGWITEEEGNVELCSIYEQLTDDAMFLVRSLGGFAKRKKRKYGYVADIKLPICPFRLERKAKQYKNNQTFTKLISSIKEVGEGECTCITVDAEDSLYLTNDFIVTHNTFHDAICILDEAQNCTKAQLKLFLTRLGKNSRMIITGDPSQSDLVKNLTDLTTVVSKLEDLDGIGAVYFDEEMVVRHPLVTQMLKRL